MKAIAILPAAAAAILTLSISVASSQEVCLKDYQTCMDRCSAKQGPQMQDSCIQNCQANNNMCSDRVFGGGAIVNVPQASAAPAKQATDAMAKKQPRGRDYKKVQKKEEAPAPAPVAEQQQDAAPGPAGQEQPAEH